MSVLEMLFDVLFVKMHITFTNAGDFLNISSKQRFEEAKTYKLCTNCLRQGYVVRDCRSRSCYKCNNWHHTLLHIEQMSSETRKANTGKTIPTKLISNNSCVL